jgi:hypothetical protein
MSSKYLLSPCNTVPSILDDIEGTVLHGDRRRAWYSIEYPTLHGNRRALDDIEGTVLHGDSRALDDIEDAVLHGDRIVFAI